MAARARAAEVQMEGEEEKVARADSRGGMAPAVMQAAEPVEDAAARACRVLQADAATGSCPSEDSRRRMRWAGDRAARGWEAPEELGTAHAPCRRRACTTSRWPLEHAIERGVLLSLVLASTAAPLCSSKRTTARWPFWLAKKKGVPPFLY
jgi:hypothetical protein